MHDLVLVGGRVLDPESGRDGVANVAIDGGLISAVTEEPLRARREIDVSGSVVAPGWIDLHSHSHTVVGLRLQALDGVTTALELEGGLARVQEAYAHAADEGRPINYGYSSSWAQHRMRATMPGLAGASGPEPLLHNIGDPRWQRIVSPRELSALLSAIEQDLEAGALGIGILVGYAPGVDPYEYVAVSRLAARHGVPTYTHARDLVEVEPDVRIDGAQEVVRAAEQTGVHAHYCHITSTSMRHVDRVLALVETIRAGGSRVSTEAYPYGAGMTAIGAEFLRPRRLARRGLTPESIVYAPRSERIGEVERLAELQAADPGGLAIVHFLDEADASERAYIDRAILAKDTIIASDAMPLAGADPVAWPPTPGSITHPRTAGTFSKVLRRYVRELGAMTPLEAVRRLSLLPAQTLQDAVPGMRRKGRVQVGCDADLVVLDLARVSDTATYDASIAPSVGYSYVFVGGRPLVADSVLDETILPGRAVRRT